MLSQSCSWLAFCVNSSLTRTVIHFFPSSGSIGAPYQVTCAFTLFGAGLSRRTVVLEGARLSNPDGVRLEQVFPNVLDSSGNFYGLELELSTSQPRVDLSLSECVVELVSRSGSVRFWPNCITPVDGKTAKSVARKSSTVRVCTDATKSELEDTDQPNNAVELEQSSGAREASFLKLADAYNDTSVIVVNPTPSVKYSELASWSNQDHEALKPIETNTAAGKGEMHQKHGKLRINRDLPPESVVEVTLESVSGCSLSREQVDGMSIRIPTEVAAYALYRDTNSKRPVSVTQI